MYECLETRLECLRDEAVLVQAWKKASSYMRYHNWFSDTLEIDYEAVRLPDFIKEISQVIQRRQDWRSDPLRIVPAPRSQHWKISTGKREWEPEDPNVPPLRIRPLAHVSLRDQVISTALLLCLADRVETIQGSTENRSFAIEDRKKVISYGNRLFCDSSNGKLYHRWGSRKLYRSYFEDYRAFLTRPEIVAESAEARRCRAVVMYSDLSQFYDRVRPEELATKLMQLKSSQREEGFFEFAKCFLEWHWHDEDKLTADSYSEAAGIEHFERVALPQGLVSAGFFANLFLLDVDKTIKASIGGEILPGVILEDACRYVDDLRLVLIIENEFELKYLKKKVEKYLQDLLDRFARGLKVSEEKTKMAELTSEKNTLVRQSSKMRRIQSAISGGFDAIAGEEIVDAIRGLIRSQHELGRGLSDDGWPFSPVADVRDETVERFAAARFRVTYRSLRPLLEERVAEDVTYEARSEPVTREERTRADLDNEARAFSLNLIERWVKDPSNVRLLRIGFDIFPDPVVLREVINLLRLSSMAKDEATRQIANYCLSELLKACVIETGIVEDKESLPSGSDLSGYRSVLREEVKRVLSMKTSFSPWYLQQQALLFLATYYPKETPEGLKFRGKEHKRHNMLIRFIVGNKLRIRAKEYATLAVLVRQSFCGREDAVRLTLPSLTRKAFNEVAKVDPSFALEIISLDNQRKRDLLPQLKADLCPSNREEEGLQYLTRIVTDSAPNYEIRNELTLLQFAVKFLESLSHTGKRRRAIGPNEVLIAFKPDGEVRRIETVTIAPSKTGVSETLYDPPKCVQPQKLWRFQLGFLIRFILTANPDFTRSVHRKSNSRDGAGYVPAEGHRYQRLFGLQNSHSSFGYDWLPISDWMERFLLALLRWPGCRRPEDMGWVESDRKEAIRRIRQRISELEEKQDPGVGVFMIPRVVELSRRDTDQKSLRGCVVQTVLPSSDDFGSGDLQLNNPETRRLHRRHLSSSLAAVVRMLRLRETHRNNEGRLDWLIFPELSVHPSDIRTHLLPFSRAYKTVILAGLTYDRVHHSKSLTNSAIWIIPEWSKNRGLHLCTLRQGKHNLAYEESILSDKSTQIEGFRPCQWLIGYKWALEDQKRLLWLTASICYDATDLSLATSLRSRSDVFAVPARNKDVKTFDQMVLSLHYHMFQLVIVANNGQYGGSSAYWPRSNIHERQVFHLHGQPQATIAFFEISDIADFLDRKNTENSNSNWKKPPAGLWNR